MAAHISSLHSFFLDRAHGRISPSILQVLSRTRASTATNPMDSIYAKLGISRDGLAIVPNPSYTITVADLYRSLVKSHFLRTVSLYIICFAGPTTMTLPSWVPDWSSSFGTRPLLGASFEQYEAQIRDDTAEDYGELWPAGVMFSEDGRSLFFDGWTVDTIGVFNDTNEIWTTGGHTLEILLRTFTTQQIFFPSLTKVTWDPQYYLDFARTLVDGNTQHLTTASTVSMRVIEAAFRDVIDQYQQTFIAGKTLQTWAREYLINDALKSSSRPHSTLPLRAAYKNAITQMIIGRNLLGTVHGRPALVPDHTAYGDLVCILGRCPVPVILRQVGSNYTLIGECYVDDFMGFDMWQKMAVEGPPEKLFEIR